LHLEEEDSYQYILAKPVNPIYLLNIMTHIIKGQELFVETMFPDKILEKHKDKNHTVLKVLIADDNSMCRNAIFRILSSFKYEITQFENGMEALEEYKKSANSYDLLILDHFMPIMDGVQAIVQIREYENNEKIISTPIICTF